MVVLGAWAPVLAHRSWSLPDKSIAICSLPSDLTRRCGCSGPGASGGGSSAARFAGADFGGAPPIYPAANHPGNQSSCGTSARALASCSHQCSSRIGRHAGVPDGCRTARSRAAGRKCAGGRAVAACHGVVPPGRDGGGTPEHSGKHPQRYPVGEGPGSVRPDLSTARSVDRGSS